MDTSNIDKQAQWNIVDAESSFSLSESEKWVDVLE